VYEEKKNQQIVEEEVNKSNVGIFKTLLGVEEIFTVQEENPSM